MTEHIVYRATRPQPNQTREQNALFNERETFEPLRSLATGSLKGKLTVLNELVNTGYALVEATEDAIETLKNSGFTITPNRTYKLPSPRPLLRKR